jgi:hypothetical protein
MTTILERLAARTKAATEAAGAAKAQRSPDDEAEIAARAATEAAEATARDEKAKNRKLDLDRRYDAAVEKYGAPLRAIDLEATTEGAGTWIVKPSDKDVVGVFQKAAKQPNADSSKMYRDVAASCVVDWNGVPEAAISGEDMHALWNRLGMIPTTLGNAAIELGGFVADTKSGGG